MTGLAAGLEKIDSLTCVICTNVGGGVLKTTSMVPKAIEAAGIMQ